MAQANEYFGFNTTQINTLRKLLGAAEDSPLTEDSPLANLPTVDPQDGVTIWNDAGVLKVAST